MSTLLAYWDRILQGMEQCFESDRTIVLLLAALLVLWLREKKTQNVRAGRVLIYTLIMAILLLCPVTAVVAGIYQTAFYDYAWLWSMVPVIIVIAYAAVVLQEELFSGLVQWKKGIAVVLAVATLLMCISHGGMLTVDAKEKQVRVQTAKLVTRLEEAKQAELVLWAPRKVMQEVRRQTGEFMLIYGKDMWDAKSGAYDYEAYSQEFMDAYEWMELIAVLAEDVASQEIFNALYAEYSVVGKEEIYLRTMLTAGMNVLILPNFAAEYFEENVYELAEEEKFTLEKLYTEQYVLYLWK